MTLESKKKMGDDRASLSAIAKYARAHSYYQSWFCTVQYVHIFTLLSGISTKLLIVMLVCTYTCIILVVWLSSIIRICAEFVHCAVWRKLLSDGAARAGLVLSARTLPQCRWIPRWYLLCRWKLGHHRHLHHYWSIRCVHRFLSTNHSFCQALCACATNDTSNSASIN